MKPGLTAIAGNFGTTQLAINLGDGTIRSLENAVLREAQFARGSAPGDIGRDAHLDWFVSSVPDPGTEHFAPNGYPGTLISECDAYDFDPSRIQQRSSKGFSSSGRRLTLATVRSGRARNCMALLQPASQARRW